MTTDSPELNPLKREELVELLASRLTIDPDLPLAVTWPIATYRTTSGHVTIHNETNPTYCLPAQLLEVSALATTFDSGVRDLRLGDFHCLRRDRPSRGGEFNPWLHYESPVSVVATPRSDVPTILTTQSRVFRENRPSDSLEITIRSWDLSGEPMPNVPFSMHCTVKVDYRSDS